MTKTATLKKSLKNENKCNFDQIKLLLSSFNMNRNTVIFNKNHEISQNQNGINLRKKKIVENESLIRILEEKKSQIKGNIENLKETISRKKIELENKIKENKKEKNDEKNAQIMIFNIRKSTFSLVLEYIKK